MGATVIRFLRDRQPSEQKAPCFNSQCNTDSVIQLKSCSHCHDAGWQTALHSRLLMRNTTCTVVLVSVRVTQYKQAHLHNNSNTTIVLTYQTHMPANESICPGCQQTQTLSPLSGAHPTTTQKSMSRQQHAARPAQRPAAHAPAPPPPVVFCGC